MFRLYNSHHQANVKHSLGTYNVRALWDPMSFTPVAAVTVYTAPDDGHKGRPKHVEHTCSC